MPVSSSPCGLLAPSLALRPVTSRHFWPRSLFLFLFLLNVLGVSSASFAQTSSRTTSLPAAAAKVTPAGNTSPHPVDVGPSEANDTFAETLRTHTAPKARATAPRAVVTGAGIVNDTDSGIAYTGSWFYSSGRGAGDYQDDVHATQNNGDSVSYTFTGTGISYVTEANSDEGNVQVYIDGTLQATVNCYSAARQVQAVQFSTSSLANGSHTLKLVKQDGAYMILDALQVTAAPVTIINDTNSGVTYTGGWFYSSSRGASDYQDDVHATAGNGDSVSYTFTGNSVSYVTEINTDEGNVQVYVDGTLRATVNCYSAARQVQQVLYSITSLTSGSHTLKLVKQDGQYMLLDALGFPPVPGTTLNDTDSGIAYAGSSWGHYGGRSIGDYQDDVHATANNGDSASYTFTGTGISYITETSADEGNVQVYLDGALQTTVNCYNSGRQVQQAVYVASGLSASSHALKLVKQDGQYMLLDALRFIPAAASTSLRIDSGSAAAYTDTRGFVWLPDQYSSGGTATSTTTAITGTSDQTLYQTQDAGTSFTYTIPVANGKYLLSLLFAEIQGNTTGQRKFTVKAGSQTLLSSFDIYAAAGGANKAVIQNFTVPVTNGQLVLTFTGNVGSAAVAALQLSLIPATGGIIYGAPSGSQPAADIPPPGWAEDTAPMDDSSDADGMGPSMGGPVNAASGVEENSPGADLWAYNPAGPGAAYSRLYRSARAVQGYGSPGLSPGWTDDYDQFVTVSGSTYVMVYPNGGQDIWTGTTGNLNPPVGAPYAVVQTPAAGTVPAFITVTQKDRSKEVFTQVAAAGGNYAAGTYLLTKTTNLVGHSALINRDTAANGYRLLSVTNDAATPLTLLAFAYSAAGTLSTVTDPTGIRQITYGFAGGSLSTVSQIAASGTTTPPTRWGYGYTPLSGHPLLTQVQAPSPASPGTLASAYTDYYDTGAVAEHLDATGRSKFYFYQNGQTVLQSNNPNGTPAYAFTQKVGTGSKNQDTGMADALNHSTSIAYGGGGSPYLPSAFTNRNNQIMQLQYDPANNYSNVVSATDNRGTQINTTYDYSDFALGQPSLIQRVHVPSVNGVPQPQNAPDSTLTPTQITYYKAATAPLPSFIGLVSQTLSPLPDTVAGTTPTVPTTFAYDTTLVGGLPLGNVATVTTVGPNSVIGTPSSYTTASYSYTNGTVTTPALGEPVSVTVAGMAPSGGPATLNTQTSTFTYDNRGNQTSATDASSYTTTMVYNLADQVISVIYPATGAQGSGQAHTDTTYQYVGGPVQSVIVYDEAGAAVREVDTTYTAEGEVASVKGSTQPSSYLYDGRGRVAQMTDGNNNATFYNYDSVGNLAQELFPLNAGTSAGTFDTLTYTYDADQNLMTKTDGRGLVTTYTRSDPDSLVTGVSYSAVSGVTPIAPIAFSYDPYYGRRLGMTDGTGTTTYGPYDDLDELLSVSKSFTGGPQSQALTYAHNPDGSRQSMGTPLATGINGNRFTSLYDGLGRMAQSNFPWTDGVWQSQYQPNGWMKRTDGPLVSGAAHLVQSFYSYNQRGFLTQLINYSGYKDTSDQSVYLSNTSAFSGMTYDALGNRLTETAQIPAIRYYDDASNYHSFSPDASHKVAYGYDSASSTPSVNRDVMLSETGTQTGDAFYNTGYGHTFGYDSAYNPTTFGFWNTSAGSDQSYSPLAFSADNQYSTGDFGLSWLYDGDGNPTTYKSATFGFDAEDRLVSSSSPAFSAAYDGDGLRASKTAAGVTTYFLYDGTDPVLEETYSNATTTVTAASGWHADGLRARYLPGSSFAYDFSFDPQGSVVERQTRGSFTTGSWAYDTAVYEGYGAKRSDYGAFSSAANHAPAHTDPVGFGGQYGYYTDIETGLLCLTHRYYDPGTGKFVNRDPIGYAGGANLYGFCDGNPVNESDPDGTNGWTNFWAKVKRWWWGPGIASGPHIGQGHGNDVGLTAEEMENGGVSQLDAHPQQASHKLVAAEGAVAGIVVNGVTSAPIEGEKVEAEAVEASAPILGRKLLYLFGKATGRQHNIDRSLAMAGQLRSIGLSDTPATREYLAEHFAGVLADPTNISRVGKNGTVVRESLLAGPGGYLKMESYWAGNKLETVMLYGRGK